MRAIKRRACEASVYLLKLVEGLIATTVESRLNPLSVEKIQGPLVQVDDECCVVGGGGDCASGHERPVEAVGEVE